MAALGNHARDEISDQVMNAVAGTFPASLFIALFTDLLDETDSGTEVSGFAYARVQVTAGFTTFATPTRSNDADITFAQASGGNWGNVQSWGAYDLLTVGNLWLWGPLTTAKQIDDGDTFAFEAGDLDVSWT